MADPAVLVKPSSPVGFAVGDAVRLTRGGVHNLGRVHRVSAVHQRWFGQVIRLGCRRDGLAPAYLEPAESHRWRDLCANCGWR